jgi:NAD(P)-dependent dehydrogenase (short-subunit alcohol dehydrogenase family)
MELSVAGRTALVTGASGGLGRHFAELLAREGASVVIAARRADKLAEVAKQIEADGGEVSTLVMDVADHDSVTAALGPQAPCFDIVVNNAGGGTIRPALQEDVAGWREMLGSNVDGTWWVSQATAARMVAEGRGGSIINLGSVLGLRVMSQTTAYATSKAAVVQLTKQLALEWARYGIRVNALCPGYFPTEGEAWQDPDVMAALPRRVPMRRLGQLHELDGALLLLASDAGSFITATTLVVDGGHTSAGV